MGFGEQGYQISSRSRSLRCKIYETTSCVKWLLFRRAKELNRPCHCTDVNLTTGTQALSLLPPNATLSTAQNTCSYCTLSQTESLTRSLSNNDSDATTTRTVKEQYRIRWAKQQLCTWFTHSFLTFFLSFLHFLTFVTRLRRENS